MLYAVGSDMEISKSTSIRSATGDMCVAGFWMGASTTMGGTTLTNALAATSDAYVAKLDTDGNVAWAKSWGGSGDEFATSAFDKSGETRHKRHGTYLAFLWLGLFWERCF